MSATIKLGSLEKPVIASLFHSGLDSGTIFLWKKRCHMLFLGTTGMLFFDKKYQKNYDARLIFDRLQLFLVKPFFDQVPNKGSALENPVSLEPKWKNPGSGVSS